MSITQKMKSTLLSIDQVRERLANTEPLSTDHISSASKILFKLEPGWETTLDALDGTARVGAVMRVNGVDHPMTRDAALQAASNVGLPQAYVKRTPAKLIEAHLNYHYAAGMGSDEYKILSVGEDIAAFTRPNLVPFSNLQLLEQALEGIRNHYGSSEILADYKIANALHQTDVRLIVPEAQRIMQGTDMVDTPAGADDLWSAGIHLSNSLIGKSQTTIEAYLFRWWCTNGATEEAPDIGVWSRRKDGQDEDVYQWAADAVDGVLGGMEERFDRVQALTQLSVAHNTAEVLKEIFTAHNVPVTQREQVRENVIEANELNLYTVMNAITATANVEGVQPARADKLMRIGGSIPTSTYDPLKAQLWREGHTADPTAKNPYEITPVS